ncbi:ABC transporter substrate-binding protein [Acrocarpospora macrocephala]|uniref:ABC transporter substrate-binding protein n=1 Tax=Acrocarpospora macrocephala TaxID=150177 RepID=A0A5M3WQC7_9ACTN|nr:ABC transporter substrate-binding protein [Acrocarpospora macrocephala]GES08468.1 ABC transporter substrate-binding protein [Acrocarpospora macrocephala]
MTRIFSTKVGQGTVGVLLTLTIPLAACSNAQTQASSPSGSTGLASADREGILRAAAGLTTPSLSGSFDPVKSISGCDILLGRLIFGTLITLAPDRTIKPGLVESWDVVDEKTLDLHIRANMKFHNGEVFDAKAVKAGIDRNRAKDSAYAGSLEAIVDAEAVDDKTVRIRTSRPAAGGLLATFAGREGMIPAPASIADGTLGTTPIGAGPFKVAEWRPGESMKLRRHDAYFDPDQFPYAGIDFVHLTDVAAVRNALLADNLDLGFVDLEGIDALKANPRTGAQVNTSDSAYYVNLNTSLHDPPLDNLKVRQALNYAFNRAEVAKTIFGPTAAPKWQIFPKGFPGHDPALENYYTFDPAKAKQLLAEAGYPNGFAMTMQAFPTGPSARSAEVLKSNLADIGVNLTIVPGPNMTQDYHIDKKTNAGQNWWIPRTDPTLTFLSLYGPVGVLNTSKYSNPALNDIVYGVQGSTDQAEINTGLQQASKIIVEEAREIGVAYTPSTWGYSARVGFKDGALRDYGNACTGADFSSIFIKKT